jgi:ribosomal protein S18 acetylase RimI-like enzyme
VLAYRRTETSEAGVRVRRMEGSDVERVLELRSVVRWAADPRAFELLRGVGSARWAVAEAPDGGLAGMVGAVPLGPVGILCHLAVHHEHRGLGLGRGLSAWAVAYLRGRGAKTIRLYATKPAEGIYRSLGFGEMGARTVYRLEGGSRGGYGDRGVRTLQFGDLAELYGVDRWGYGADRSALIYSALGLNPGLGLISRDSAGRIEGYLIRVTTGDAVRLGPFLARTPDVARRLLSRVLGETGGSPVRVIAPDPEDCPSHRVFEEFGFTGHRDRVRMELGDGISQDGLVHYGTTPFLAT